jgi:tetratricopeptide (TPR) repeat protein
MQTSRTTVSRFSILAAALLLAAVTASAQGTRAPAQTLAQQVTTALGRGAVDEARRLVQAATGPAAQRELAAALLDIFEGRFDQARTRLEPLASANPGGDAALELGLLEQSRGRRERARKLLIPLSQNRNLNSTDDYFRLARAARVVREFQLANDAYQRIADVPRADIQAEYADLFLQFHQPADAVTNYRKALEADKGWIPALIGLSRAYADDEPEVSRASFEAARKQAPNHPDVLQLAAERALETDEVPAAKTALDELRKVRPGTKEEAALRVAIAYQEGGVAAVEPAVAASGEQPPRTALLYRLAGQQAASKYRFEEAVTFARKATLADSEDPDAQVDLGLYLLRTGDEKDARVALDLAWSFDRSNRVTFNLLNMLDSLEKFVVIPAGDLVFKFSPQEAEVLKPYALSLGAEAYKTFSTRYGFKPSGPILIEVFPEHDDFAVRTLGLPGLVGALGACFGRVVTMDSPRARKQGIDFSWQATLWHEMAHVFTLQLSKYRVPRWLTEGISTFEEHRRQPAWGRELTLEFGRQLARGRTFGVKNLPDAFKRPELLALAYFEASLVVEHLVELNGDAGLRTLLLAYADGASDTDAFAKAFGRSVDAVETSFKTFIDKRYAALRAAMGDPPQPVEPGDLPGLTSRAAAAPGNFLSQLSLGQALVKANQPAAAKAPLEKAAHLAPEASGDGSPRALLAAIAEREGDPGRARRELRQLLTYDHTNVNAARKLAMLASAPDAIDDRDFALRLVADLDPFDTTAHAQLGRRLLEKGDNAAALIEFQAALAGGPANLAEAHTDSAEALLKLGRRDEARRAALLALKEAPTYARAQDLLLAAMGKD